jgi:RND family efflux transporter MFP subunit
VRLKAPISGVIVAAHVTPGEYVKPEKLLFEIVDTSSIWVEADIYETDLSLVEKASRALIFSEAYPNDKFTGTLNFIGQRLDPNSRTVKAVFNVKNDRNRLREGMFVDMSIETQIRETGLMFAKAAVVNERGRKVVYIKTSPETFLASPVEIKGIWGDRVMVSSGVKEGDIVVVQGMYQVRSSANKPGEYP